MAGHACDLIGTDGTVRPLDVQQWMRMPDAADHALFLDRCVGPTLDVGCGPGRLAGALTARGIKTLGIDISLEAVRLAHQRGAVAVHKDVFDQVPDEGRWCDALLADTNVGIGGDPVRLLERIGQLVCPKGAVLVEVEPPGTGVVHATVQLRVSGRVTETFDWSRVGADAIGDVAAAAGFRECELHRHDDRYMARLTRNGRS